MTICTKCQGSKAVVAASPVQDKKQNKTTVHSAGATPAATVCSQCNGTGIQNSFGV